VLFCDVLFCDVLFCDVLFCASSTIAPTMGAVDDAVVWFAALKARVERGAVDDAFDDADDAPSGTVFVATVLIVLDLLMVVAFRIVRCASISTRIPEPV